jgi:hypothetical protein
MEKYLEKADKPQNELKTDRPVTHGVNSWRSTG